MVSLGRGDLIKNDQYVTLVTACLASGCDRVIDVFQEHGSQVSLSRKQRLLLTIFVEALAMIAGPSDFRERYLIYHRDSLFRFLLAPVDKPETRATELSARCEENLAKTLDHSQALPLYITNTLKHPHVTPNIWQQKVTAFYQWISTPHNHFGRCDPFAWDPRFTPIFTLLHGISNQLGIKLLNEGFLCHLLLAAMGVKRPQVEFYPNWEWATS